MSGALCLILVAQAHFVECYKRQLPSSLEQRIVVANLRNVCSYKQMAYADYLTDVVDQLFISFLQTACFIMLPLCR